MYESYRAYLESLSEIEGDKKFHRAIDSMTEDMAVAAEMVSRTIAILQNEPALGALSLHTNTTTVTCADWMVELAACATYIQAIMIGASTFETECTHPDEPIRVRFYIDPKVQDRHFEWLMQAKGEHQFQVAIQRTLAAVHDQVYQFVRLTAMSQEDEGFLNRIVQAYPDDPSYGKALSGLATHIKGSGEWMWQTFRDTQEWLDSLEKASGARD